MRRSGEPFEPKPALVFEPALQRTPLLAAWDSPVSDGGFDSGAPAAPATVAASISPTPAADSGLAERWALVVEDNEVNQRVLTGMLGRLGWMCRLAHNGAQAVKLVAASEFEVILMDCHMPVMDGFEAARRIRAAGAQDGRRRVPIIAVTADARSESRPLCLEAGMDDFLSKPFRRAELEEILRKWVQF